MKWKYIKCYLKLVFKNIKNFKLTLIFIRLEKFYLKLKILYKI